MVVCRFPFVRFLCAFVVGLLMAMHQVIVSYKGASIVLIFLVALYILLLIGAYPHPSLRQNNAVMGVVGLAALSTAGTVRFLQKQPIRNEKHLLYHTEGVEAYEGVIIAHRLHGEYVQLTLALSRIQHKEDWYDMVGKVRVWVAADSYDYRYGDVLRITGGLQRIRGPRNPYAFDMQRFAAQQGVYHQAFIATTGQILCCGYAPRSRIIAIAYRMRSFLADRLSAQLHDPIVRSITLALVLGIRDDIGKELTDAFSAAGILHILAVSGLHVGMLYAILLFLLHLLGAVGYRRRWLQGGGSDHLFMGLCFDHSFVSIGGACGDDDIVIYASKACR